MSKKHGKTPVRGPAQPNKRTPWAPRVLSLLERFALPATIVLVLIASARIVATYSVFGHTTDEPAHIACGIEYLDKKTYQYEFQHPPLARVMIALGPYLAGARSHAQPWLYTEGTAILYENYDKYLALARLGILPFFWVASFVVYFWGARYFGKAVAVVAVLLFTLLPPVLAHAGLATTDMALTGWLGAAFLAALVWAERSTLSHSLLFGAAVGLAVLSKFSAFAFFPAVVMTTLIWRLLAQRPGWRLAADWARHRILPFCLAVLVGALVIWAGYRFSLGKVDFASFRLPAPELFAGIEQVEEHNARGHPAYLLGESRQTGWWYYYLVVLAVKTPLPYLLLTVFGTALCLRKRAPWPFRAPLAFLLGILLVAVFSRINIGVRHILPIYLGASLAAAVGAIQLLQLASSRRWAAGALGALLLWLVAAGALQHPDYIAYFNELVGDEPEKVLVDSDLDWGQDIKRLGRRLHEVGAREVAFTSSTIADLEGKQGFPPVKPVNPIVPNAEWVALSPTSWKLSRPDLSREHPNAAFWPDRLKPTERVGAILLYHFPAPQQQP